MSNSLIPPPPASTDSPVLELPLESASQPTQQWPKIETPLRLVGSTGTTYCGSIVETTNNPFFLDGNQRMNNEESNVFKSLQWTPDGTTLLTHSEDHGLRTFILPPDLLEPGQRSLKPYNTTFSPSRIYSYLIHPHATLSSPGSMLYLCSPRDSLIRLHSLLGPDMISSYRLEDPETEAHLTPHSLLIPSSSPHTFLAGTSNKISFFDLNYSGSGPFEQIRTTPFKKASQTTYNMKGLIMAMAISTDAILAAGTNTRMVGLYDYEGSGKCITTFEVEGRGGGVTGLHWSNCGAYLYVVERRSDVIKVYDVRSTWSMVGELRGYKGSGNQRIGVEVQPDGTVVSGGDDGVVRIWNGFDGEAVGGWRAHEDPVTCAAVHPGGAVVATCSGTRRGVEWEDSSDSEEDEEEESVWDNSLKIWEMPPNVTRAVALEA
ncbi:WD40-repeat-containing domain protein [Pyronema omphalodes]|nr:WD40-repeat-containing domain protein [Pyronema omphalodes]